MNERISADISNSFSHCSLNKVTGKRPRPIDRDCMDERMSYENAAMLALAKKLNLVS
jgi:hypothetical protein